MKTPAPNSPAPARTEHRRQRLRGALVLAACVSFLAPCQPTWAAACQDTPISDWISQIPAHQRRILPLDCKQLTATPIFSWAEARDRARDTPWLFTLRRVNSSTALLTQDDVQTSQLILPRDLASGDYEWSVSYKNTRGAWVVSAWRRFSIQAPASALRKATTKTAASEAHAFPDGPSLSRSVASRAHPRLLPAGSSFESIAEAAQQADQLPVLNALRASARFALTQPLPLNPSKRGEAGTLAKVQDEHAMRHSARSQREYIETLAVIGRIDRDNALLDSARHRLQALADWSPDGPSSEAASDQTNREIYLALATGLDLFWQDLTDAERTRITTALRARILQAVKALDYLEREPYEAHRTSNVRWINQTLLLAAGLPGFSEAQGLLARLWDLSRFTLSIWGGDDGSFGNGIAYGWYAFVSAVPYVATVRITTGIDLYQLSVLRRAGEQLIAFTAPNHKQPSAFGDETETQDLYANYAPNYFRLHAQMTRDPVDAWYWQVNTANLSKPKDPLVWQLLLLGADNSPLPQPQAPMQNSWYFRDAGLAALHVKTAQSARTSLFFRSSRFGAFNHSHADQNSVVYVSQGQPLLINAGYYPYYDSPHHKSVTRATRYKNALTFDGGFGQSESRLGAPRPSDPLHSMDASGTLLRAEDIDSLSVLTGDATAAYRAANPATGTWVPLLSNAVRSVVMDRASGSTLIYDWATSATPRRWELNFHSPQAFTVDGGTVKASQGGASVCLDTHGPASSFTQTMDWDVAPEVSQPAQAHGRFTVQVPSTELAHLTVLRDGCRDSTLKLEQTGTRIQVTLGRQRVSFDKRQVLLGP